uniref:S-protein homolog n=1 Tax=Solanum tuberosum TaxID=4113 RepID=M1DUB3_SOLTU
MPYNIQGYCEIKSEVHVHNDLPQNTPQLEVHCASGDDELGYRYPEIGTKFNWSFCPNPSTLFFCHFWWNGKDLVFDVDNKMEGCVYDKDYGSIPEDTIDCHWQVKADGIYLGYCEIKSEVHVHNDLPQNTPQLEVHCASGDDELGYRYPEIGTEFNWSFCPTFSTLYFCHFWWNGKDLVFDVDNKMEGCVYDKDYGSIPEDTIDCHWQVKADGIYLGYFNRYLGRHVFSMYRTW